MVPKVSLRLRSTPSHCFVSFTRSVRGCFCDRCLSSIRDSLGVLLKAHRDNLRANRVEDFAVIFGSYQGFPREIEAYLESSDRSEWTT
jgi:hypothetical protein